MNTNIQIFKNNQFGEVRVVEVDGKTYFVGIDVAKALGYTNPRKAINDHCRGVTKRYIGVETGVKSDGSPAFQQVEMLVIPEGDIYRIAAKSELPAAEAFESWIFDEVLPAIRKHGVYATDVTIDAIIADPEFGIRLLSNLKEEKQKRLEAESKVKQQAPKVLFADAVATSDRSVLVSELAKVLKQNGTEIGQNRLFIWLREHGYLCSKGEYYNQPTQRAMELGLFEIKKTSITKPDGVVLVTSTTKVTGKGQIYFVNKFLNKETISTF
jgi:anti-repressor protein